MGKKHYFNLIEIAVALGVAAIGVASIMALLPLSIKSSADAVGDTIATDAANTVITKLDEAIWSDFSVARNLPKYSSRTVGTFSKSTELADLGSDESYAFKNGDLKDGKFDFFFGPKGKKSDFAAQVRIWQDDSCLVTTTTGPTLKGIKPVYNNQPAMIRVYIEFTWPLAKEYSISPKDDFGKTVTVYPRQSRLFVREYFDPEYSN